MILSVASQMPVEAPIEISRWSSHGVPERVRPRQEREAAVVADRWEAVRGWRCTFETMLPCERMTPFGLPVVPEV